MPDSSSDERGVTSGEPKQKEPERSKGHSMHGWGREILKRLAGLKLPAARELEIIEEVAQHLEDRYHEFLAGGMTEKEARRAALEELSDPSADRLARGLRQVEQEVPQEPLVPGGGSGSNFLAGISQDIRYGLRQFRRNPTFTIVAVLTLALGIGANTAVFSMVNALLLHPYDFRDLDHLVRVWEDRGVDGGYDARWIAPADAADLRDSTRVFESLATYRCQDFNLAAGGDAQAVLGCAVSANFFDVLGVGPALGRTLTEREEEPGLDRAVIVSHGFWQRRFGGQPTLLGKTIELNGGSYTVVGIMPPRFNFPLPSELWVPLALAPAERADRAHLSLQALGRLRRGVSVAEARAALGTVSRRLQQLYPATNSGKSPTLLPLRQELYLYTLPLFLLLQAAAGFVLVLACANLANLLLTRVIERQKEIALRSALGADRYRLLQLFVCEALVFSLAAGLVAVATSFWSVKLLRTSISADWTKWVPGWDGIQVDHTVLAGTILVAAAVGVFLGLASALHAVRVDLNSTLKEAGGSVTPGRGRLRSALVVAQVMSALVLLVCAGLMIQGFVRLAHVYQGFEPANVLKLEIRLPEKDYATNAKVTSFFQQALRAVTNLPGVSGAALVRNTPASNVDNETTLFTIEGQPARQASQAPSADLEVASPDYFRTLKIRIVAGRVFSDADSRDGARVAVINQSMAERFWPGGNALGHRIKLGAPDSSEPWLTVVGIVGDVRQNWWNPLTRAAIYESYLQAPYRGMKLVLRAASNPMSYVSAGREALRRIDPGVALTEINSLEVEVADSIAIVRIMGILMGVFGLVALALSSMGVYGVLSESVAQRTREIGIRMALGAHPRQMMKLVLGRALRLTGIALAMAVPISFAVSRVMASLMFGIVTANLVVLAAFTVLFITVALAAGYFPAQRAAKVDPMVALRYE